MALWLLLSTTAITYQSQGMTVVSGSLLDDTGPIYPLVQAAGGTFITATDTTARAACGVVYYARSLGASSAICDQIMQSVVGGEAADLASVIYGNGGSGVVTFDGVAAYSFATLVGSTYTLTANFQCADGSSIANGVTVAPASYGIFCNGTLTNNGTISLPGNNASGSTGGASTPSAFLGHGAPGGNGGANGGFGTTGKDTQNAFKSYSANGGAGGGPTGGIARVSGLMQKNVFGPYAMFLGFLYNYLKNSTAPLVPLMFGGNGGDGGDSGGSGATAGGGGGAGGALLLAVKTLINNGTIQAHGGNGSAASGSGNAGGGGGGGGGSLFLITSQASTGSGNYNVLGGSGGAGIGTGAAGRNGQSGVVNCYYL